MHDMFLCIFTLCTTFPCHLLCRLLFCFKLCKHATVLISLQNSLVHSVDSRRMRKVKILLKDYAYALLELLPVVKV